MNKLKMHTPDMTDKNIERIAALFPNVITEIKDDSGVARKAVDFDLLKQVLSKEIVEGDDERYRLDWPGKKAALLKANMPLTKTLRPCREESVNFDATGNLYIEGDNFEVLKVLQESYLGKVKMIYIDPPYNTGNDFIYKDNFAVDSEQWKVVSGEYDEEGGKLFRNTDSNGRFHSDWLSMMYERLVVARDLLKDDGVIFISIDDNEVHNLRKICDEVFGEENFVAEMVWERAYSPKNDAKYISNSHDYILMYTRHIESFQIGRLPRTEEANARYLNPDNDPRGVWKTSDLSAKRYTPADRYPITTPSGRVVEPPTGRSWSLSAKAFAERLADNRIWFGIDGNSVPQMKRFLSELRHEGMAPQSILFYKAVGHSQEGAQEVTKLLESGAFDGPKPLRLLNRLLILANTQSNDIILDFFSGSATTAHAVMQLNAEEVDSDKLPTNRSQLITNHSPLSTKKGNRKFIMVQLPEKTDENSEAYKAGYKTIADIGKERIRRAGKKVVSEKWEVISMEEKIRCGCRELPREVGSEQWTVGSKELTTNHSQLTTKTNGGSDYGCKELPRADCMAKGNGSGQGSLFDSQKTSKGGTVQPVGPNTAGSGFNPVKHSGGASTEFNQGVSAIYGDSKGLKSGTGDSTASLRESRIPCRYGHFGSDATLTGDRENAVCSFKNTVHCPLTTKHSIDIGFRVYKTDESNMKDVFYHPAKLDQEQLAFVESNIKEDRTPEDLLTQVILDLGLELSLPIETKKIGKNTVFIVQTNALVACFDNDIDFKIVDTIAGLKPFKVVFKDASFKDDKDRINVEERFKRLSPETRVTVI
ncbi:adenine specific DNA methylase Mod [Candidatus Omnitrophus magneticus]|uniref:site-specific DNA-methyltransferase (adenine-specific) n=1 Tax=Candidatus Omnitrophus magneticus TaxID=1609969 RepID=A0A0F0CMT8_9BACT|nr:adenine specific DNA methylase Mod [Candidatus Omnitrophus magneticus]